MLCPLDAEAVVSCSSELEVHSELLYHDFVRLLADAMRAVSSDADVTSVPPYYCDMGWCSHDRLVLCCLALGRLPCPLDLLMLLFGPGCVLEDAVCPRPVPRPQPWPGHLGCSPSSTSDGDVASIGGDICSSLPDLEVTSASPMTQKLELGQAYASLEPLVVMAAERGCTRVYT